jgi:hypothetical protein
LWAKRERWKMRDGRDERGERDGVRRMRERKRERDSSAKDPPASVCVKTSESKRERGVSVRESESEKERKRLFLRNRPTTTPLHPSIHPSPSEHKHTKK